MSWARWSDDSDVYIFENLAHGITCCACILMDSGDYECRTKRRMRIHIQEHIKAGHKISSDLLKRLKIKEATVSLSLSNNGNPRRERSMRWLIKLLEKLFQWLRGHRLQAVAAEVAPRRGARVPPRLPKTGGAFGNPRWMREAGVKPL